MVLSDQTLFLSWKEEVKNYKPDIIIGFGILNTYLATAIARNYNLPFVYYLIDVLHTLIPSRIFQPLGRIIEGIILQRADRVVVINHKLQDYNTRMGSPQGKDPSYWRGSGFNAFPLEYRWR